MACFRLDYHVFLQELCQSINVGDTELRVRKGVYVFLMDEHDVCVGVGEASPLPGLSKESVDDVCVSLQSISKIHCDMDISYAQRLRQGFDSFSVYPSVQFAIESALLMRLSEATVRVSCHMFFSTVSKAVTALIKMNKQVTRNVLKVKIARESLESEIAGIKELLNHHPNIMLRLDANQKLGFDDVTGFVSQIPTQNIDYIEDPCDEYEQYEGFYRKTGVGLAVDYPYHVCDFEGIKTLVIKPTVVGGVCSIQALCRKYDVDRYVISSCYETAIGLSGCSHLAYFFGPAISHGLSTLMMFKSFANTNFDFETLSFSCEDACRWIKLYG